MTRCDTWAAKSWDPVLTSRVLLSIKASLRGVSPKLTYMLRLPIIWDLFQLVKKKPPRLSKLGLNIKSLDIRLNLGWGLLWTVSASSCSLSEPEMLVFQIGIDLRLSLNILKPPWHLLKLSLEIQSPDISPEAVFLVMCDPSMNELWAT